jgi:hypothetical protein
MHAKKLSGRDGELQPLESGRSLPFPFWLSGCSCDAHREKGESGDESRRTKLAGSQLNTPAISAEIRTKRAVASSAYAPSSTGEATVRLVSPRRSQGFRMS